jgi:hypothetical protein
MLGAVPLPGAVVYGQRSRVVNAIRHDVGAGSCCTGDDGHSELAETWVHHDAVQDEIEAR